MKIKKWIALALAVPMILATFSGCSLLISAGRKILSSYTNRRGTEVVASADETQTAETKETAATKESAGTKEGTVTEPEPWEEERLPDIESDTYTYPKRVIVLHHQVNVRSGAGTGNKVLGLAEIGGIYTYLGERIDNQGVTWYEIRMPNGKSGYVTSEFSRIYDQQKDEDYRLYMNMKLADSYRKHIAAEWTAVSASSDGGQLRAEHLVFGSDGRFTAFDREWSQLWTYSNRADWAGAADSDGWVFAPRGYVTYSGTYKIEANYRDPDSCTVTLKVGGTEYEPGYSQTITLRYTNGAALTGAYPQCSGTSLHQYHKYSSAATPEKTYREFKKNKWLTSHGL